MIQGYFKSSIITFFSKKMNIKPIEYVYITLIIIGLMISSIYFEQKKSYKYKEVTVYEYNGTYYSIIKSKNQSDTVVYFNNQWYYHPEHKKVKNINNNILNQKLISFKLKK
jgi:hypothetical protein